MSSTEVFSQILGMWNKAIQEAVISQGLTGKAEAGLIEERIYEDRGNADPSNTTEVVCRDLHCKDNGAVVIRLVRVGTSYRVKAGE